MKYQKKIIIPEIKNHSELETSTQQYSELFYYKDKLHNSLDNELIAIKKKFQEKIEPINNLLNEIEKSIFDYLNNNKKSIFIDKKSITTNFAKLGYRKINEIQLPENLEELIRRLKESGNTHCIKYSESVKKSVLSSFNNTELEHLGITKNSKETPFIIPVLSIK